ncbi:MAG: hypothetical protein WCH98_11570 [Verrucomicrobiota bacterium]
MLPSRSGGLLAFLLFAAALPCFGADARVLGTDRDLDGLSPFPAKPLTSWQWTPEEKKRADEFSSMSLTRDPSGNMLWTLKVSPDIPFKRPYLETLDLGIKFFPPEADAIRMKVRAVSGKVIIGPGGPTAYFGNSDVFLRPVIVDAAKDGPEWRTVEFSLHDGLIRNFRRAGFSANAPWIYYARWAQEPTRFYVFKGSGGEIQIKDLEIITRGIAKPFPVFAGGDLTPVATLADFHSNDALKTFTALVSGSSKEFDASWNLSEKIARPPPEISVADDPESGRALHSKGLFLEEMSAVGIELSNVKDSDGLHFRIKADTDAGNAMIPAVPCQPLDFLLYLSTDGSAFDWKPFGPAKELLTGSRKGYDRNLSYDKLKEMPGLSLAIYHARRFVPKGRWCDVVIPFADFLCIYGSGDLSDRFQKQLPPDPKKLIAAAILAPWPRKGRFVTSIDIREISLVKLRNDGGNRRSYYQHPDPSSLRSLKSQKGGYSFLLAPGEADLPQDLKDLLKQME